MSQTRDEAFNIILTPHMSGVYDGYKAMNVKLSCENIQRLIKGEALLNGVKRRSAARRV